MSVAIMSTLIISALNIANLTYQVGVEGRERTEAAHLAQMQAERLIALRDREMTRLKDTDPYRQNVSLFQNDTAFTGFANAGSAYHIDQSLNLQAGQCPLTDCGRYNVTITSDVAQSPYIPPASSINPNLWLRATVQVTWTSLVGGDNGQNNFSLPVWLVDKRGNTLADCTAKRGADDTTNQQCAYVNTGPITPPPAATPPSRIPLYVAHNDAVSDHFYTTDINLYNQAIAAGYQRGSSGASSSNLVGYLYDAEWPPERTCGLLQYYSSSERAHWYGCATDSPPAGYALQSPTPIGYILRQPGTGSQLWEYKSSSYPDYLYTPSNLPAPPFGGVRRLVGYIFGTP